MAARLDESARSKEKVERAYEQRKRDLIVFGHVQ
jgi:hypothetical protein